MKHINREIVALERKAQEFQELLTIVKRAVETPPPQVERPCRQLDLEARGSVMEYLDFHARGIKVVFDDGREVTWTYTDKPFSAELADWIART